VRIEGNATLPANSERVYALLLDPIVLAACIPGCQELIADGEGVYKMKMKVVIAAVSGDFVGKVSIEDPSPPNSYRLRIDGNGRIGIIKGVGDLKLATAEGGGTTVSYEGDAQVGGTIAAVGQRLLDTTARMMIRRFFDNLTKAVTNGHGPAVS